MKRSARISICCFILLTACARVEIPKFTSVTCSADPVGPPVTNATKIEKLSEALRALPGRWKQIGDAEVKAGLAVVLRCDSRAVAQVVIGDGWLSIQATDDLGTPLLNAPIFMKQITAADREQITRLATERPNKSAEPTAMTRPPSATISAPLAHL